MNAQVLFLQGSGKGAFDLDRLLATSLQHCLGPSYDVRYPRMPEEETAGYSDWRARISEELGQLSDRIVLVGHSAGGSIVLKYLTQERMEKRVVGLFVLAAPFFGAGGWEIADLALPADANVRLSSITPIIFYHKRDDQIVPVTHVEQYASMLPQATIRVSDRGGHQFANDLSDVSADIAATST